MAQSDEKPIGDILITYSFCNFDYQINRLHRYSTLFYPIIFASMKNSCLVGEALSSASST